MDEASLVAYSAIAAYEDVASDRLSKNFYSENISNDLFSFLKGRGGCVCKKNK